LDLAQQDAAAAKQQVVALEDKAAHKEVPHTDTVYATDAEVAVYKQKLQDSTDADARNQLTIRMLREKITSLEQANRKLAASTPTKEAGKGKAAGMAAGAQGTPSPSPLGDGAAMVEPEATIPSPRAKRALGVGASPREKGVSAIPVARRPPPVKTGTTTPSSAAKLPSQYVDPSSMSKTAFMDCIVELQRDPGQAPSVVLNNSKNSPVAPPSQAQTAKIEEYQEKVAQLEGIVDSFVRKLQEARDNESVTLARFEDLESRYQVRTPPPGSLEKSCKLHLTFCRLTSSHVSWLSPGIAKGNGRYQATHGQDGWAGGTNRPGRRRRRGKARGMPRAAGACRQQKPAVRGEMRRVRQRHRKFRPQAERGT
jgi:hypothetical protein